MSYAIVSRPKVDALMQADASSITNDYMPYQLLTSKVVKDICIRVCETSFHQFTCRTEADDIFTINKLFSVFIGEDRFFYVTRLWKASNECDIRNKGLADLKTWSFGHVLKYVEKSIIKFGRYW